MLVPCVTSLFGYGAGRDRSSSGTVGESGDSTDRPPGSRVSGQPGSWRMVRGGDKTNNPRGSGRVASKATQDCRVTEQVPVICPTTTEPHVSCCKTAIKSARSRPQPGGVFRQPPRAGSPGPTATGWDELASIGTSDVFCSRWSPSLTRLAQMSRAEISWYCAPFRLTAWLQSLRRAGRGVTGIWMRRRVSSMNSAVPGYSRSLVTENGSRKSP